MPERLRSAYDALEDDQRVVLHLARQGLTYTEIAKRLDVPRDVVSALAVEAVTALTAARRAA